ncbi:hypothetical protein SDC9_174702 [bioreactor metagenome]|uniref:Uncharacterized protein n=1 Tax=bioreactor metagenome TaxID=1076179 RepID=A0A645GN17_9ZZZZ
MKGTRVEQTFEIPFNPKRITSARSKQRMPPVTYVEMPQLSFSSMEIEFA